jgi:hypothetical protein
MFSDRLPIAAARIRAQVKSCQIFGGKNGAEAGFLLVLQFPLPIINFRLLLHNHHYLWRIVSSGMLRRVTRVCTRATRRNIPEDTILHSHRRENLKSYIIIYHPRLVQ